MTLRPHALALAFFLVPASQCAGLGLGTFAGSTVEWEGLLQVDHHAYHGARFGRLDPSRRSDAGMRRAELILAGTGPGRASWEIAYDAHLRRWLNVQFGLDLGKGHRLHAGQFKQPLGLEELTSTRNADFISKAAASNALAPGRRLAANYAYAGEGWGVSASALDRSLNAGGPQGAGYAVRATWAPIRTSGRTLHLGLAHVSHDIPGGTQRLSARPQSDLSSERIIDSGRFTDASRLDTRSAEGVWLAGPLKLQAEYLQGTLERTTAPDYTARGGYLSAVWNLGGEAWSYRDGLPRSPSPASARGLWQLSARLETLDLDDAGIEGGRMDAITLGVNWYGGDHFRLSLNGSGVDSRRRAVPEDLEVVSVRAQVRW
jgi:phosphate-selective porin OprO/OprP